MRNYCTDALVRTMICGSLHTIHYTGPVTPVTLRGQAKNRKRLPVYFFGHCRETNYSVAEKYPSARTDHDSSMLLVANREETCFSKEKLNYPA